MIDADKRRAALTLFHAGKHKKQIARLLKLNIKTVRQIIAAGDEGIAGKPRKDNIEVDEALLRRVYHRCRGYIQRTHEVLTEENGLDIGYSTLTRKIRELGLGERKNARSSHVPDAPGEEMQHDTSPYSLKIGGKEVQVICSGLYMRYSKMRYIKFYRRFNRFTMKCFMDEALGFWGYSAGFCIIDNTSLAIWYGSGPRAIMVPEMVSFGRNYGFEWKAHEISHSNRKAGKERNFWTVETNFFPGRTFASLEDLNEQAYRWATQRYAKRPQSKTGLIPIDTFEHEKSYLTKLPEYIPPVCKPHERGLDAYGYAAFQANYYWVPEHSSKGERIRHVQIIEHAAHIVILHKLAELVRYDLPKDGVRNEKFAPEGVNLRYKPKHRKKSSVEEERELRNMGRTLGEYVDFVKSEHSRIHYKNQYLRNLYLLAGKMSDLLLQNTMERALKYKVNKIDAIARIASQLISQSPGDADPAMAEQVQHDYMDREAYIKGRFGDEPGFRELGSLLDRHNNENQDTSPSHEDGPL